MKWLKKMMPRGIWGFAGFAVILLLVGIFFPGLLDKVKELGSKAKSKVSGGGTETPKVG